MVYTREWIVLLFVFFALGFGLLAISEARRFSRDLGAPSVREDGVDLPMKLGRLGGRSHVPKSMISRVDLHADPYGLLVEIALKDGGRTPSVVLEKDFILDWAAFVAALRRLGIVSSQLPSTSARRGAAGRFRNHYGVRRLRGQGVVVGGLMGMILAVVFLSIPDRLLALAVGLAAMLMVLAYFLFINRRVPLDFSVQRNALSIRTMTGVREFPLDRSKIYVGGSRVLVQDQGDRWWLFDFVNPDDAAVFWPPPDEG